MWWLVGGITIQLASILDGCDGEIARLKLLHSARGAWLDTVLDRYADVAMGIAVTFAAARLNTSPAIWLGGFVAVTGFLLASYVTKEFQLRAGEPYPNNGVNRLKRRDLRILVVAVGSVVGYPYLALLLVGALSHGAVFHILATGMRPAAAVRPVANLDVRAAPAAAEASVRLGTSITADRGGRIVQEGSTRWIDQSEN